MVLNEELFDLLSGLEVELHQLATRKNPDRLGQLLHPDFEEFGQSGLRYSRQDVLREFSRLETLSQIATSEFALRLVSPDVALLTYVSAHGDENGDLGRSILRSSVWIRVAVGWQLIFHQGTPTDQEVRAL